MSFGAGKKKKKTTHKVYLKTGEKNIWNQEECILSLPQALQYRKSLFYCDVM